MKEILQLAIKFSPTYFLLSLISLQSALAAPADFVADAVLGQSSLTSGTAGASSSGFATPTISVVDQASGRIYVSMYGQNRVMSWPNASSFTNNQAADIVLGQADSAGIAANRGGAASSVTLNGPVGLVLDKQGNLYIADSGNNRVLEYDNPSILGITADRVFGQPDFATVTSGTTNAKFNSPTGVALSPTGVLYVSMINGNRVLAFQFPLDTDTIADAVWGQTDFVTATSGTSAIKFTSPAGVAVDSEGNLYVADFGNNRVVEFNGGFESFDAAADRVYGQPDFATANPGTTDSKFSGPYSINLDKNGSLFVADVLNQRIMIFDTPLLGVSGSIGAANRIIGQSAFNLAAPGTTASTVFDPYNVSFDQSGNLFMCDSGNNRVLRFDVPTADNAPVTQFTSNDSVFINPIGAATPFPSVLNVYGLSGTVSKVSVVLKHLSHTFPDDMDIFLVGPTGKSSKLISDISGANDLYHVNFTLDDSAPTSLSDNGVNLSGTYRPTDFGADGAALFAGMGSVLDIFNGENPNGDWSLYAIDDAGGADQGALDAWGLNIYTVPQIASLIAAPAAGKIGEPITFSILATAAPGDPINYQWDFGDGSVGSGSNISHSYSAAGTFNILVTATATNGGSANQSASVTISAPAPTPTAVPVTDLVPATLSVKKGKGKFTCSFQVQNKGANPAAATRAEIRFGIASDSTGSLAKRFAVPALAAGKKSNKLSVTKAPGRNKYCRFVVDSAFTLVETSEGNNAKSKLVR